MTNILLILVLILALLDVPELKFWVILICSCWLLLDFLRWLKGTKYEN